MTVERLSSLLRAFSPRLWGEGWHIDAPQEEWDAQARRRAADLGRILLRDVQRASSRTDFDVDVAQMVALVGMGLERARGRICAHVLRATAVDEIWATEVRELPDEPPRLLVGAWIIEVDDYTRTRLFGDVVALAGVAAGGRHSIVALAADTSMSIQHWTPPWGRSLPADAALEAVGSGAFWSGRDLGTVLARATSLGTTLGILLECEGTPLAVTDARDKIPRALRGQPSVLTRREWVTRYVSITPRAAEAARRATEWAAALAPGDTSHLSVVRGHTKLQPCGPRGAERKMIYVAGYEARRWVSAAPLRTVVK